ncbi:MAG: serine/threonine protein kinase [Deltaproteobacteria bacterium]|nr:serine/threonine protein kinase [Deltaproteobacteria bacterium]
MDLSSPVDLESGVARYELGPLLGDGGMGEVRRCRDLRIGREVAVKLLGPQQREDPEVRARFVREARIQGQLEHPAVVPLYDFGAWSDGVPYFTMTRVRGVTLREVLDVLAAGDAEFRARYSRRPVNRAGLGDHGAENPEAIARYSQRRLLTAFSAVCLAVDYAHARGVVHRDLKPANLMFGEFGEVHVLDWGVAKVLSSAGGAAGTRPVDAPNPIPSVQGTLLGTPGYMAPEAACGEVDTLDARADVYALGAILFELLTLHPLHEGTTLRGLLSATLLGADARASQRFPAANAPPELEAICVRATATDPAQRHTTARELSDAIERYLDGDRDLAVRCEVASTHERAARAAAARALAGGEGAEVARVEALREATRAVALDPSNEGAVQTITRLLLNPPARLPDEVQRELDDRTIRGRRGAARLGIYALLSWFLFYPLALAMGVRSWASLAAPFALHLGSLALAAWLWRSGRTRVRHALSLMAMSTLAIASLSGIAGPFVLVPAVAVMSAVFFTLHGNARTQGLVVLLSVLTVLLPFVFELLDLVDPAYTFQEGSITMHPRLFFLSPTATRVFLLATSVAVVLTPMFLVARLRDALADAERGLCLHLWHVRQMVPEEARQVISSPPAAGRSAVR